MNILLAIDDSKYSEAATEAVMARMWPSNTSFKVVSVLDESESPRSNQAEPNFPTPASGSQEAVKKVVAGVTTRLKEKFPDADIDEQILFGNPKESLLDCAANWPADLIAVGTHGRRGLTRILLGSVSQSLLLYGQCSTLIVRLPVSDKKAGALNKSPERLLVPLDPSEHSRRALDWILQLPWSDHTQFKILCVLPPLVSGHMDGLSLLQGDEHSSDRLKGRATAERLIDECKSKLAGAFGAERVSGEVTEGDAGETIVRVAEKWPADLVLMGTRGHGTVKRLWLGSISQAVVLQAPCPVEVVKCLIP
jgi:nucleotide-binding universal stress UspA family protein